VAPVKGVEGFNRASPVTGPTYVDATIAGKRLRRGARLWTVAVSTFKAETYRFLGQDRPTREEVEAGTAFPPGTIHLPDWADGEWLKQLTAEQLVTVRNRRGFAKLEWQKLRERQRGAGRAGQCPCRGMDPRRRPLVRSSLGGPRCAAGREGGAGTRHSRSAARAGVVSPVRRPVQRRTVQSSYMR
jgi:hypothetical protein